MYLYEKQDDKVLIHNFIRDKEELKAYRKSELSKISRDDIEYCLEERVKEYDEPLFRKLSLHNIIVYEPMEQIYFSYPKINKVKYLNNILINNYYNGIYAKRDLVSFVGEKNTYYLLAYRFNEPQYRIGKDNKSYQLYTMGGIIHLPETLAILQLIEQGRSYLIPENAKEENIQSVLNLYKDEVVDEIDLENLRKTDMYNVTHRIYDDAVTKVSIKSKNDFNIVKRLKK